MFYQRPFCSDDDIPDDLFLIEITSLQQIRDLTFNVAFSDRNAAIADELVQCRVQCISDTDERREAHLCSGPFDVADITGHYIDSFPEFRLCQMLFDPLFTDAFSKFMIIEFDTHSRLLSLIFSYRIVIIGHIMLSLK